MRHAIRRADLLRLGLAAATAAATGAATGAAAMPAAAQTLPPRTTAPVRISFYN